MCKKNISKNDQNLLNLHSYLINIIKDPEKFNDKIDLSTLKSQGNLAKINCLEYKIKPTSLNTLKRRSPDLFSGGFSELEVLRKKAYHSILNLRKPVEEKERGTINATKILNQEVQKLKMTNILLTNLFLDNLKIIDSLKSVNSIEIIKKQLNELSKKMKSYGVLDDELLTLTENTNIIQLKDLK